MGMHFKKRVWSSCAATAFLIFLALLALILTLKFLVKTRRLVFEEGSIKWGSVVVEGIVTRNMTTDERCAFFEQSASKFASTDAYLAYCKTNSTIPLENVWVTCKRSSYSYAFSATTDSKGRFCFRGLPSGLYSLDAFKPWQGRSDERSIEVNGNAKQRPSFFQLQMPPLGYPAADLLSIRGKVMNIERIGLKQVRVYFDDRPIILAESSRGSKQHQGWTNADGTFLFWDMRNPDVFAIFDYLRTGNESYCPRGEFGVMTKDHLPETKTAQTVKLVTKHQLKLARSLLKNADIIDRRNGGKGFKEAENLSFPSSYSNTITNVTITTDRNNLWVPKR